MATRAPVVIPTEVTISGANAVDVGSASDLGEGWITKVAVVCTKTNPPHGRYYGQVILASGKGDVSGINSVLWSGYVCIAQMISSIPNVKLTGGEKIYFQVVGNRNGNSGDQMVANITVSSEPSQGCFLFNEVPGNGPGDIANISLTEPAAGADFANVAVGGRSAERLLAFGGTLATGATAATRIFRIVRELSNGSGILFDVSPATFAASVTGTLFAVFGGGEGATNAFSMPASGQVNFKLSDIRLQSGFVFGFSTLGLQAADQWSGGFMTVESWAMPEGG